jgi:GTP-binding protein HflX
MYEIEPPEAVEHACLVGFEDLTPSHNGRNISVDELRALVMTAGVIPVAELVCKGRGLNPATCIGRGKAHELATLCKVHDVHLVAVDRELSPAQARNLERITDAKIVDRTGVILEIFAQRARSREGKLQVELAQLEYLLPRLTRMWTHLSRQYGGMGTRGPGETQLEVDRRTVQQRIRRLHTLLEDVRRQRATQRKQRQQSLTPVIAIAGYTNAGKSTLLRTLTKADVLIEDKLFATLDPTTRLHRTRSGERFLFVDTVGFIRNLPHRLVESFKATLEEVHEADAILHIADASAPDLDEQIESVHAVLRELDADTRPQMLALNKIDKLSHRARKEREAQYPDAALISAQYGYGFSDLFDKLRATLPPTSRQTRLRLPPHKSELLSRLYEQGHVLSADYREDAIMVEALVPEAMVAETQRYRVKGEAVVSDQ